MDGRGMSPSSHRSFVGVSLSERTEMPAGSKYKTEDKCIEDGQFAFDTYTDGTQVPAPSSEERFIPLKKGETFPPIRSSGKACYWLQKR
jgi:hypothetical protein